jgi:hypothetical protein
MHGESMHGRPPCMRKGFIRVHAPTHSSCAADPPRRRHHPAARLHLIASAIACAARRRRCSRAAAEAAARPPIVYTHGPHAEPRWHAAIGGRGGVCGGQASLAHQRGARCCRLPRQPHAARLRRHLHRDLLLGCSCELATATHSKKKKKKTESEEPAKIDARRTPPVAQHLRASMLLASTQQHLACGSRQQAGGASRRRPSSFSARGRRGGIARVSSYDPEVMPPPPPPPPPPMPPRTEQVRLALHAAALHAWETTVGRASTACTCPHTLHAHENSVCSRERWSLCMGGVLAVLAARREGSVTPPCHACSRTGACCCRVPQLPVLACC